MAIQIIDQLEPVQIEVAKRQQLAVLYPVDGQVELASDTATVQHLGQGVVVGQKIQFLHGSGFFGYVLQRAFNHAVRQSCLH